MAKGKKVEIIEVIDVSHSVVDDEKIDVRITDLPEKDCLYAQRQILQYPPWTDGKPVRLEETRNEKGEVSIKKYIVDLPSLKYYSFALLPSSPDWLMFLCLFKKLQQKIENGKIPKKIKTSAYEIIEEMKWGQSGQNYARVQQSLIDTWQNVKSESVEFGKDGKKKTKTYGIIDQVTRDEDGKYEVHWNLEWLKRFGEAVLSEVKEINLAHRTALKTPNARRFFDFVDAAIEGKEGVVILPAKKWHEELKLPKSQPYASVILRKMKESADYINRELPGLDFMVEDIKGPEKEIRVTMGCRREKLPDNPPQRFLGIMDILPEDIRNSRKIMQMAYNRWFNNEQKALMEINMLNAILMLARSSERDVKLAEVVLGFLIEEAPGKGYEWLTDVMLYCEERRNDKRKKAIEDFSSYFRYIAKQGNIEAWKEKKKKSEEDKKKKPQTVDIVEYSEEAQLRAVVMDAYAEKLDAYISKIPSQTIEQIREMVNFTSDEKIALKGMPEEQIEIIVNGKIRESCETMMLLEYDKTLGIDRDDLIRNSSEYILPSAVTYLKQGAQNMNGFHRAQINDKLFIEWLRGTYKKQVCLSEIKQKVQDKDLIVVAPI
jgi:hypothetical protein